MADSPTDLRNIAERIARLECRAEAHSADARREAADARGEREFVERHFAKINADLAAIRAEMASYRAELSHYRGTFGGIVLLATAIVTFFKLFWDDISKFFR